MNVLKGLVCHFLSAAMSWAEELQCSHGYRRRAW